MFVSSAMCSHRSRARAPFEIAARVVGHPQPANGPEEFGRVGHALADLARARVGLLALGRRIAPRRRVRGADRREQPELHAVAHRAFGNLRQQRDAAAQLHDRFLIRRAAERVNAGVDPGADRLRRLSRLGEMVREQLGVRRRVIGKLLLERFRRAAVILAPRAFQQQLVRGILNERVLERVLALGSRRW